MPRQTNTQFRMNKNQGIVLYSQLHLMWLTIAEKKFLYLAENFLVMIYNMMNKKYTIKLSKAYSILVYKL